MFPSALQVCFDLALPRICPCRIASFGDSNTLTPRSIETRFNGTPASKSSIAKVPLNRSSTDWEIQSVL
jgi:hypothetical protein